MARSNTKYVRGDRIYEYSIDQLVGLDDEHSVGDVCDFNLTIEPSRELEQSELKSQLELVLGKLPENEAVVLRHAFGIGDSDEISQVEIAKRIGCTEGRITQLIASALRRAKFKAKEIGLVPT